MIIEKLELPAPRLQLRWVKNEAHSHYEWACHYEIVIPLDEDDIRREIYDKNYNLVGKRSELVASLGGPSMRSSDLPPCTRYDGNKFCDMPFRDGAHAIWDSAALGGLPIYVIDLNGEAFKYDPEVDMAIK